MKTLKAKKVPKNLAPILWSADIDQLDLQKDKGYIIHQVLIFGTMEEIAWLFKIYSKREIAEVFFSKPYKNYPRNIFYFVKNYLLGCQGKKVREEAYVTSIYGPVRPRTPPSVFET